MTLTEILDYSGYFVAQDEELQTNKLLYVDLGKLHSVNLTGQGQIEHREIINIPIDWLSKAYIRANAPKAHLQAYEYMHVYSWVGKLPEEFLRQFSYSFEVDGLSRYLTMDVEYDELILKEVVVWFLKRGYGVMCKPINKNTTVSIQIDTQGFKQR